MPFSTFKFNINALLALLIITLPLSVKLFFTGLNSEIIYPAELLIGILALLFVHKCFIKKDIQIDKTFLKHPLTVLVLFYMLINGVAVISSTMFLVSLKALIVKYSYITVFYFLLYSWFKKSAESFYEMIKLYGFSLIVVVIYALYAQMESGFTRHGGGFASYPFYSDHTIFAAALAFLIPVFFTFNLNAKTLEKSKMELVLNSCVLFLFIIALYFSFCRAAWLSVLTCLATFALIRIGAGFFTLISLSIAILLSVIFSFNYFKESFKENKIDSNSHTGGLYEQFFSLTNISNDVSNTERLNRWSCSIRMFKDKPFLGFGPGTYQFQYLKYQLAEETTYISATKPFTPGSTTYSWSPTQGLSLGRDFSLLQGGGGTAHSEYFLELTEGGIFSCLAFIGLSVASLFYGLKIFLKSTNKKVKTMAIAALFGLLTYFIHGLFNNFLDDCKLAFLFWASLSTLAAISSGNYSEVEDRLN